MSNKRKDNKLYWPIDKLQNWDRNPREIKTEDFDRLKKQIKELGEYKPLIITPEGIVLGGNMRLRAYKDLGMTECWVSIVEPKDEAEKVKYALSDNDSAGYYVIDELTNLIESVEFPPEDLADYKAEISKSMSLEKILNGDMLDSTKPEDKDLDYSGQYQVVIDCKDEAEQQKIYDELTENGYNCRVLTL